MQQNQIKKIEGLELNTKIHTLDIAVNKVVQLENIDHLPDLVELWMNWNHLEDTDYNKEYLKKLKLTAIYLADNPMSMSDNYQNLLMTAIPSLKQIDGNVLNMGRPFHHQRTEGIHPIVRKPVDPQAKELLDKVLKP